MMSKNLAPKRLGAWARAAQTGNRQERSNISVNKVHVSHQFLIVTLCGAFAGL